MYPDSEKKNTPTFEFVMYSKSISLSIAIASVTRVNARYKLMIDINTVPRSECEKQIS